MVAVDVWEEFQVTPLVRSCVLPSLKMSVAVNCWLIPIPSVRPTGVTTMAEIVPVLTVSVVDPLMGPRVAEIVVVPVEMPVALPFASIVATEVADDAQVTSELRSLLLPSL